MQEEKSLVERLVSLSPDYLSRREILKRRGSGAVVGAKRGSRLIADNLRLIEEALACGVSRQSILDEINRELPEDMQLTLKGFDTAKWRHKKRLKKQLEESAVPVKENDGPTDQSQEVIVEVKDSASTPVAIKQAGNDDGERATNPGDLRRVFTSFDPDEPDSD